MKSIQRLLPAMLTIALSLLLLAACGEEDIETPAAPETSAVEPAPEASAPAPPPEPVEELRYSGETPEGDPYRAQMGGDVVMPENIPAGFPIHPGGKLHAAIETGETALVTIDFAESGRDLYRYYVTELRQLGWNISNQMNLGKTHALNATGEEHQVAIQIEETASGSRVTLAFQPKT